MQPDLLRLLACPACHGEFAGIEAQPEPSELGCTSCGAVYTVRDGVPILLPADVDAGRVHDELDHAHKRDQAVYYDREIAEEFEITRPHDEPYLYRWILADKFRRSVRLLPPLAGATVLVACCGSGMDAEMLARSGARVIALDIAEGCARRARRRAARFGLDYFTVVGDVERLPVRDTSIDIAYVHDGLHHLEDPARGLRELARVAARAVSINEPANAFGTAIAVRLGLALAREDAGNRVARLRPGEVARELAAAGFEARAARYFMYYKHQPGAFIRTASRPPLRRLYRAGAVAADAAIGRWGNKLQVTAHRRAA